MRIGLFGGTFDPVHSEHVAICREAIHHLNLDRLIVIPAGSPPHKDMPQSFSGADKLHRLNMCSIAFEGLPGAQISSFETDSLQKNYSYITLEHFSGLYPKDNLFFIVGADSLLDFQSWKNPGRILQLCKLAVCMRDGYDLDAARHAALRLGDAALTFPYTGAAVSSTQLRVMLEFGFSPPQLNPRVLEYIQQHSLYTRYFEIIQKLRPLISEKRFLHTAGTAAEALKLAKLTGLDQNKAFVAAALHDCAKELSPAKLAKLGYREHKDLPEGVRHAFSGSFVAEKLFGITDTAIINAIKYHSTGRAGMTLLEKIIFIADLIEPSRDFDAVHILRRAVYEDFENGLRICIEYCYENIKQRIGKRMMPLTEQAYRFYCGY